MARLIFIDKEFRGRIYEFVLPKTTIGRGDYNTLAIHDPSVSKTHCEVLVYGTEVIVRDLGSTNGTFVNGVRLRNQQSQLKHGQVVKFGLVEARLELEQPSSTDTATDVTAIHSFARHLQDPQIEPKKPAVHSMVIEPGPEAPHPDHPSMPPDPIRGDEAIAHPRQDRPLP